MSAYTKRLLAKGKRCWTTKQVQLGNSDTIIPEKSEGIFLSPLPSDGNYLVWFHTLGASMHGVVPKDSLRW